MRVFEEASAHVEEVKLGIMRSHRNLREAWSWLLPVGMQMIGRRNADIDVLAASAASERLRPWHDNYLHCRDRSLRV